MWIDNGQIYDGTLDAPKGMVKLAFCVGDGWQEIKRVKISRIIEGDPASDRIEDEPLGIADCYLGAHESGRWNLIVTVPYEWLTESQRIDLDVRSYVDSQDETA